MGAIFEKCGNCQSDIKIDTTGEEEVVTSDCGGHGILYFCSENCKDNFYSELGDQ